MLYPIEPINHEAPDRLTADQAEVRRLSAIDEYAAQHASAPRNARRAAHLGTAYPPFDTEPPPLPSETHGEAAIESGGTSEPKGAENAPGRGSEADSEWQATVLRDESERLHAEAENAWIDFEDGADVSCWVADNLFVSAYLAGRTAGSKEGHRLGFIGGKAYAEAVAKYPSPAREEAPVSEGPVTYRVAAQPDPLAVAGPDILELLIDRIRWRQAKGLETYGMPLRAGNGRDALGDLLDELLDGAAYALQAIYERDHPRPAPGREKAKTAAWWVVLNSKDERNRMAQFPGFDVGFDAGYDAGQAAAGELAETQEAGRLVCLETALKLIANWPTAYSDFTPTEMATWARAALRENQDG